MSTQSPCHFLQNLLCKFKKWNLILYTFLMISYMYIAPGEGHTTPFDVNTKPLSLFTKFENLLWSPIYIHFFHVSPYVNSPRQGQRASGSVDAHLKPGPGIYFNAFIHVHSLRAGADYPLGTKVDVNRKPLSLCPFVACKPLSLCPFVARFKTISLKSDFIHIFSCFVTCI